MLLPKIHRNHMLPIMWSHEPCRNIELKTLKTCRPGSVRQTRPSPIGNGVPGGSRPVSSPGISPNSHTDRATESADPAPSTTSHTRTFTAMMAYVTYAVRCVSFSSWYGNMSPHPFQDRRQGPERLAEAPANPRDVRFRLLGDLAPSHLSDEFFAGGRHQQRRVDLELDGVDAPRVRPTTRGHDVATSVAADVLVHLEAVAGEDGGHRRRDFRGARRIVAGAHDHPMVSHPARAPPVAVEQPRPPVGPDEVRVHVFPGRA